MSPLAERRAVIAVGAVLMFVAMELERYAGFGSGRLLLVVAAVFGWVYFTLRLYGWRPSKWPWQVWRDWWLK